MPVIACKLGFTQQTVGGATYSFNFDERFGAHVAHVHNLTHAACFLSVEHYKEAKPIETEQEASVKPAKMCKTKIKPVTDEAEPDEQGT